MGMRVEATLEAAGRFAAAVSAQEERCRRVKVLEAEKSDWGCRHTRLLLPLVGAHVFVVCRPLRLWSACLLNGAARIAVMLCTYHPRRIASRRNCSRASDFASVLAMVVPQAGLGLRARLVEELALP
jgi:hypothetical protein